MFQLKALASCRNESLSLLIESFSLLQENIREVLEDSNRNNFLNEGITERKEGKP